MIQMDRIPWTYAFVIQVLALVMASTAQDGGATQNACTLASLLFWSCSASLVLWHRGRVSRTDVLFLRWGLLAFVLIGTPVLRPVVERWSWLELVLYPSMAVLLVVPLLHLITRVFRQRSPFDGEPPPPEV
jgi:hypothetical protein